MMLTRSTTAPLEARRWNGAHANCWLVWLLCGAIASQNFLLPQSGALPRFCESPRQFEEESDPVESPCEEQESQVLAASANRDRHLHAGNSGRRIVHCGRVRVVVGRLNAHMCRPIEQSCRNGRGGPLHC